MTLEARVAALAAAIGADIKALWGASGGSPGESPSSSYGVLFEIVPWNGPAESIPVGLIPANGQKWYASTYPAAAAALEAGAQFAVSEGEWQGGAVENPDKFKGCWSLGGTDDNGRWYRAPKLNADTDYRAPFLRGSGGVDAGTMVDDRIRNITGEWARGTASELTVPSANYAGGVFYGAGDALTSAKAVGNSTNNYPGYTRLGFDASRVVPVGPENSPRFHGVIYCVRMFGAVSSPGSVDAAQLATDLAVMDARVQWVSDLPPMRLVKVDHSSPCLVKTGHGGLSIKAGTHVRVGGAYVSFLAQTAVNMPAVFVPGEDYAVFVHPDGATSCAGDPIDSPAVPPVVGAVKIGGFHYGLVAPGTTVVGGAFNTGGAGMIWTQPDVDRIAGINSFSIWDLNYRPKCDPRGMTRPDNGPWIDIYFCGTEHITNGTSRYNTDVASGTVPPKIPVEFGGDATTKYAGFSWFEANEIAFAYGKRLPTYQEFAVAAYGVTENQSPGSATTTVPATKREDGYTSKCGGEQMTGHHWVWGAVAHGGGGSGWVSGAGRGKTYGTPYGAMFGGRRGDAANAGSRSSNWNYPAWTSGWFVGLRAVCDHYQGAY